MPIFVQLVTFSSGGGKFDEKKDTRKINEVLAKLQDSGAEIRGITSSIGGMGSGMGVGSVSAVYVITYEAPAPVAI